MKVTVKVPATTANLGPGFDCLGMALPIYNIISIEETVLPGTGIEINIIPDQDLIEDMSVDNVPLDENSIVYKAIELLYNSLGQTPSELKINIKTSIPIGKGLGSSSSVVVGALVAANELLGSPADELALLSIATEIEGHPDNITPAIVGGLVICSQENDGSIFYKKLIWPEDWVVTVCIPDFELSTDISRSVLPAEVPMKHAIFNVQRMGMLINALSTKDKELMKMALNDKLHQPYRMKFIPGFAEIINKLKYFDNVLGCVLSGAGSSILVVSEKNNLEKIKNTVSEIWANQNIKCVLKTVSPVNVGAQVIRNEDVN